MSLKKNTNNKIGFFTTILLLGVFFFGYNIANAATFQINANSDVLSPGSITTLSVILNSEGVAINNAEAKIVFSADLLEVVSINKSNSVFSLWVEEPAYSNIAGTVSFNGGVPTPGFNGSNGTVISIVVKAKKAGQAYIIFSDAAIRANDGLGTDVLKLKMGKTLSITQSEDLPEVFAPTLPPPLLDISSRTNPDQNLWYKDLNPSFSWVIPTGVDAVQTAIDSTVTGLPRVVYSPAIGEKTVKDWKDGVWYFKVRARRSGVWGPTSIYTARIDSMAPEKKEINFSYDDIAKILNIHADVEDQISGIDHYEIYINDHLIKKVAVTEFTNGNYNLVYENSGDNFVKLVVVDRAGNSIESLGSFKSTAVPEQKSEKVSVMSEPLLISIGLFAIPLIYFIILLLSVITILVFGAFRFGRHYSKFCHKFKIHTSLTKGDHSKVLLVLKRRLEKHLEILQRIRQNRILSKEEKEIKEAIEGDLDEVDRAIEEQKEK